MRITNMKHLQILCASILLLTGCLLSSAAHAQEPANTQHYLGPIGVFGFTTPKDVTISKVESGSPADGKIKVGDVIIGVGGVEFKDGRRFSFFLSMGGNDNRHPLTIANGKGSGLNADKLVPLLNRVLIDIESANRAPRTEKLS